MDPNAESDTHQARGVMNRIVTGFAGPVAAVVLVLFVVAWLVTR